MVPAITHTDILSQAQKKFSLRRLFRNALPTLSYHINPRPFAPSEKITLFTCNIFPPNVIVWNHLVRKYFGDAVEVFIFDCSGDLNPKDVPGATVRKYINAMHPTKIDAFVAGAGKNSRYIWICDDDVFPSSAEGLQTLQKEFAEPKTATVSFRPRAWWHFEIDGKEYEPSGSYCVALDRSIFVDREHLNAQPADGNTHPSHREKPMSRYDTLDKSNELLIQHGYRCAIVPELERDRSFIGFDGTSIAALLLEAFPTAEALLHFFDSTTDDQWKGNVLYRCLAALLSANEVQKVCTQLRGTAYPLPTLPSDADLQRIRMRAEPLLTEGRTFTNIQEASERLLAAL